MEVKTAALELGTERIRKLLMQYSVPAIIAMTASSLYNMVDSIFIGQGVGPLAISGLALTFPLMNLSAAFGAMVGVGASTLISMRLGQRDYETAKQVLGNVVILNTVIGAYSSFPSQILQISALIGHTNYINQHFSKSKSTGELKFVPYLIHIHIYILGKTLSWPEN